MENKVIGIISWFPDISSIRGVRIRRLQLLIDQCNRLMNLPIIIIAQNWRNGEISLPENVQVYYYDKLGITGARKELRNRFLESEYNKLIMLDDDMCLWENKDYFDKYLNKVEESDIVIYKNYLINLLSVSKDILQYTKFDDIDPEKGEGFEDWIFVSNLENKYKDKVCNIYNLKLIAYDRSQLTNDPYSTWDHGEHDKEDMTQKSRKIIEENKNEAREISKYYNTML